MNYEDYRTDVRSGDILAWKLKSRWFESWYSFKVNIIALFQRDQFVHVGFALVEDGRVMVMEAVTPVVRKVPLSDELPCYIISGNGLTDAQRLKAMALVGRAKYSIWEAILAYLNKSDMTNDRWDCDEFVRYSLDIDCPGSPSKLIEHKMNSGSSIIKLSAHPQ